MTGLRVQAAALVDEMVMLGARFEIEPTPEGQTFVWFAKPPSLRDVIAAHWNAADKPPGMRAAMTAEIQRRQQGGAL